eukprot:TRINITY_DN17019_c0_g1_i2.p1 TRINITY_DN17019_c0_g1~~TRINITY_DN17019_c0_g1_i2.p1  ORF type:complete len:750 (-),score=149.50 TRINITY_DN17019_c0_g1_i2:386-2635(-)
MTKKSDAESPISPRTPIDPKPRRSTREGSFNEKAGNSNGRPRRASFATTDAAAPPQHAQPKQVEGGHGKLQRRNSHSHSLGEDVASPKLLRRASTGDLKSPLSPVLRSSSVDIQEPAAKRRSRRFKAVTDADMAALQEAINAEARPGRRRSLGSEESAASKSQYSQSSLTHRASSEDRLPLSLNAEGEVDAAVEEPQSPPGVIIKPKGAPRIPETSTQEKKPWERTLEEEYEEEEARTAPESLCNSVRELCGELRSCRWNMQRRLFAAAVGFAFALPGAILTLLMSQKLRLYSTAATATCRIELFDTDKQQLGASFAFEDSKCAERCGFIVAVTTEEYGEFWVTNWMPAYGDSYYSESGVGPTQAPFRCCPSSVTDCCRFYVADEGVFCDNIGGSDCPSGEWDCYVADAEVYLNGVVEIPPDALHVGSTDDAYAPLVGGVLMLIAGVVPLCLAFPRARIWRMLRDGAGPLKQMAQGRSGRRSPTHWEDDVLDFSDVEATDYWSAAEKAHARQVSLDTTITTDTTATEGRRASFSSSASATSMPSRHSDGIKSIDSLVAFSRSPSSPTEPLTPASAKSRRGSPWSAGEGASSRRLQAEEVERILIIIAAADVKETLKALKVKKPTKNGSGKTAVFFTPPPLFSCKGFGSVQSGHKLIQVGEDKWPHVEGKALLKTLAAQKTDVSVIFEGKPKSETTPERACKHSAAPTGPVWHREDSGGSGGPDPLTGSASLQMCRDSRWAKPTNSPTGF